MAILNKQKLIKRISKELKQTIELKHITAVVSILFEEIARDLLENQKIRIKHFGNFFLKQTKEKRHMNIATREIDTHPSRKKLRFEIAEKLRIFLINHLDVENTFGVEHETKEILHRDR